MMSLGGTLQTQHQPVFSNGVIPEWFHGILPRKTAEELLMAKPQGYFLIRISESRAGYTLSYRAENRCRHFMIDMMEDGHFIIVGEKRHHRFLQDLVDFHCHTPIVPYSDVLTVACGKPVPKTRKRYESEDLQSTTSPEVPVWNVVPQVKQNQAGSSLPPIPSIPAPTEEKGRVNINVVKNVAAKLSVVSNLKMLKKIFPTKKSRSQELFDSDSAENECKEQAVEEQTLNGCYILCSDAGLQQEYLPPPPFAPGF